MPHKVCWNHRYPNVDFGFTFRNFWKPKELIINYWHWNYRQTDLSYPFVDLISLLSFKIMLITVSDYYLIQLPCTNHHCKPERNWRDMYRNIIFSYCSRYIDNTCPKHRLIRMHASISCASFQLSIIPAFLPKTRIHKYCKTSFLYK